jgi:sortase A
MKRNSNERVVRIRSYDDEYTDTVTVRRRTPKRKGNFFSNLLTVIALIGLVVGGSILGTTLWGEYTRVELTKEFTQKATEIVETRMPRSEFQPGAGEVVGLIKFPQRDNLTVPIVDGVREQDLYAGVGHYDQTGWPGDQRQVFLAGHRNTEFGALQYVQFGETVIVEMSYGTFTYKVIPAPTDGVSGDFVHAGRVVHETQTAVINTAEAGEFPQDQLVLMTCYPFTFGASLEHRFLIYAERIQ